MSANVAELILRVQRRVIDLPNAVQSEVETLLRKAHRDIQELHRWKVLEQIATFNTTVGSHVLGSIPLDFHAYRGEPYYTDDLGTTREMKVSHSRQDVLRGFGISEDDIGEPMVLLHVEPAGDSAQTWEVYPFPDGVAQTSTGEYAVQIPYWDFRSFPSTTDWFTNNTDWYLTFKAVAECFWLDWDEERAVLWEQKAAAELKKVVGLDKAMRLSSFGTIVPYKGVLEPRLGF